MHARPPEPDDAPAVLELIVARDVADLGRPDYTLDGVKADWASPEIDLALDAWLVEDGDGPLGYALLDDGASALVAVPPASEGRGIGTLLRYLRMRIDLADAPEPPLEVPVRTFVRGDDDRAVHELIEAAMAHIPGNLRSSFESWQAGKMTTESWDPALWLLHEDAGGIAGVALCDRWQDGVGFVDYLMSRGSRLASSPCRPRTPARRGSTSRSACARSGQSSAGTRRSAEVSRGADERVPRAYRPELGRTSSATS